MANIKSSEKSARKEVIQRASNRAKMSAMRTYVKKLDIALKSNTKEEIIATFIKMQSQVAKSASSGIIKKNTASRIISMMNSKCKSVVLSK